jgi:hypothetical protein
MPGDSDRARYSPCRQRDKHGNIIGYCGTVLGTSHSGARGLEAVSSISFGGELRKPEDMSYRGRHGPRNYPQTFLPSVIDESIG